MNAKLKVWRSLITRSIHDIENTCAALPVDIEKVQISINALREQSIRLEVLNVDLEESLDAMEESKAILEFEKIEHYRLNVTNAISLADIRLAAGT